MSLDPRYIPLFHLQQDFLDKQTGLQLAGGVLYSFHDNNRNDPKALYELSGAPPNYTYTPLPNPVTLTNAGTFSDGAGNDITAYAFPYAADGSPDNYYIQVFAAPSVPPFPPVGTPILTREAVPGVTADSGPGDFGPSSLVNQLVNPQFVDVLFDTTRGLTVTYINGTTDVEFAPGWSIRIAATAGGTVLIERVAVAGLSNFATNPPYYIKVTPSGATITSLIIYQTLSNNPNIFASEFLSAGLAISPNSAAINVYYAPQGTILLPALLTASPDSSWMFRTNTNLNPLNAGANIATGDTGYVEIQFKLSNTGLSQFTSAQIVGMPENTDNLPYTQQPTIKQKSELFYYYQPELAYKPIPSYLIGWDFPLNPAQSGDAVAVQAVGANKSFYAWDQTIVFQSTNSGVSVSRETNGGFKLTTPQIGQVAVIQYLDQVEARKIISDKMAVNISASTTKVGGLAGTVSLWATNIVNLPTVAAGTNNSIVLTLDANGKPATQNLAWTEIPRVLGDARFTLQAASATNDNSLDISFNGWEPASAATADTATYFAIVVGFAPCAVNDTITLNSVALCSGDIATRPAPKTLQETLRDCERYYEKSYSAGIAPGTGTVDGLITVAQSSYNNKATNFFFQNCGFGITYRTEKRANATFTVYTASGVAGSVTCFVYDPGTPFQGTANAVLATYWTILTQSKNSVSYTIIGSLNAPVGGGGFASASMGSGWMVFHYVAEARLGIVN